jgi:serine/threonine protein kinase
MAELDLSGCTLGAFVLRERIADDVFGAVYRGEQPSLKRDVIVKVLHPQHDAAAQQRFLHEAQRVSRLEHPYAAHVYDFGVEREHGLLWVAMERVPGVTFDHWLKMHGTMPLDQFVPFFECIAQVVQAAHELGIAHCDLTPANVMVCESAGAQFPKLLDFGIDRLTRSDAEMGSPEYMAPEQWSDGVAVGPAADIYALGIVAYQALTGHMPFIAETLAGYAQLHREAPVPPLTVTFLRASAGSFGVPSPRAPRIVKKA